MLDRDLSSHHRFHVFRVVARASIAGTSYGQHFLPFSLPRLKLLDPPEHLRPEPGHVEVRPQGLLGRPHLEFGRATLQINT